MSEKNAARARRAEPTIREIALSRRARALQQQQLTGMLDERTRWAMHDACFTPTPVVDQGFDALQCMPKPPPVHARVLDCSAGGGVFGMVAKKRCKGWKVHGIEPREEERENLERHYAAVTIGTAQEFAADYPCAARPFDVVISNPPWWCWADIWRACWPLLVDGGLLIFLGPSNWGHSDETSEGIEVFDAVPPIEQWRVRGRIAFNGGSATDNRKCSWWVWRKGLEPDPRGRWMTDTLPALPVEARRWRVRPGTEGTR